MRVGVARVEALDHNWALSAFRRPQAGLERRLHSGSGVGARDGMVKLGRVAIDSSRIQANASRDRVDSEQGLRDTRARLRRQVRSWQKAADRDDAEPSGLEVAIAELDRALGELPRRLQRLKNSGLKKLSRTDEDALFLRQCGRKFVLGYSAEIAVSDDHLINPAGDAERHGQRLVAAYAGRDGTALWCATFGSPCR